MKLARESYPIRLSRPWPALVLSIALFATSIGLAQTSEPIERHPVPHSAEQNRALKAIKDQYQSEYAKREPADQLALCQEFRKLAAGSAAADPVRQYVLLREARGFAVNAGDFDAAFGAIDEMARAFAIDGQELKVTALSEALDRARVPPAQLLEGYLKVTENALVDGDVQLAWQASRLAYKAVAPLRDAAATERVKQIDLRVHDARRELTAVVAQYNKLQNKPDDPGANFIVGRYLCLVQGKWDQGLPFLAKGSDKRLSDLADKDMASPDEPNAMYQIADGWWNLPDSKQTPQRRARQRAAYWYKKALPGLNAHKKATAQQRIAEIDSDNRSGTR